MNSLNSEKDNIKKIYGDENLKEILESLLEKRFIEEIKKERN